MNEKTYLIAYPTSDPLLYRSENYLGIDGGGSKTRALLVDAKGSQLAYAESGPSNLNACDEASVRASLQEAIDQCLRSTDSAPTATCLGIAGASASHVKQRLQAMLPPRELGKIHITSDAEIALEGAFNGGAGILLIAGTGSVCFGKSADGKVHRTGGWGWLADDAGSAGWIGQRALETAVQENDGRLKSHALRDAVFKHLEIQHNEQIGAKIHQPLLDRSKVAALATQVLALAENGDAAARLIQAEALQELEKLVRATAKKLEDQMTPVALSGGLLTHHPAFRKELESKLPDFEMMAPKATALEGAVALARKI